MSLKFRSAGWLVLLIASALLVAGCSGGETTVTVTTEAPQEFEEAPVAGNVIEDVDDVEPVEEETAEADVTVHEIGSTATDEGVEVKVRKIQVVDSIPVATDWGDDGPITASKGAQLVRADVTWKNVGKKSAANFCGGGGAKLIDTDGREFDSHDRQFDASGTICDDVQPGFKSDSILVFELPKDATPDMLRIWDGNSDDDFFGGSYLLFGPVS